MRRYSLGELAAHSVPVRVFALRCLGDLVANHQDNQDTLMSAAVDIAADHSPAAAGGHG